jgi:hypothetical protein
MRMTVRGAARSQSEQGIAKNGTTVEHVHEYRTDRVAREATVPCTGIGCRPTQQMAMANSSSRSGGKQGRTGGGARGPGQANPIRNGRSGGGTCAAASWRSCGITQLAHNS